MRRIQLVLVLLVLLVAAAFGQYRPTDLGGPMSKASNGVTARVSAGLPGNGRSPIVSANVNIGVLTKVAVHVALTARDPWHEDQGWTLIACDTLVSDDAAESHKLTGSPGWDAWEGDTVHLVANVYTPDGHLIDTVARNEVIDAPGALRRWLFVAGGIAADAVSLVVAIRLARTTFAYSGSSSSACRTISRRAPSGHDS